MFLGTGNKKRTHTSTIAAFFLYSERLSLCPEVIVREVNLEVVGRGNCLLSHQKERHQQGNVQGLLFAHAVLLASTLSQVFIVRDFNLKVMGRRNRLLSQRKRISLNPNRTTFHSIKFEESRNKRGMFIFKKMRFELIASSK